MSLIFKEILPQNQQKMKGVIVLVHGLNQWPEDNQHLIDFFKLQNYLIILASLNEHRRIDSEYNTNKLDIWESEFNQLFSHAKQRSMQLKKNIIFCGYSIGALLINYWINNHPHQKYFISKIIYLAPAFILRKKLLLIKFLTYFSPFIKIPSLNKVQSRIYSSTSNASYQLLFLLNQKVKKSTQDFLIKTLHVGHCKDEVVDLMAWGKINNQQKNYSYIYIKEKSRTTTPYHYFIQNELFSDERKCHLEKIKNFLQD